MKPPPKASSENRTDSLSTTPFDRPSPNRRRMPSVETVAGGASTAGVEPPEPGHHRQADDRVADDDRPIGVGGRGAAVDESLAEQPGAERAGRGRDVADEVVPGERRGPAPVRDGLGQGGLLDGQERPDLVAGRRDDADGAGQDEQRDEAGEREDDPGQDHQRGAGDEDAPPSEPVGVGRQPQRDDRVADERQGQDDPDRQRIEADRGEVQDQDDRQEPVAEHPERPHREQEAAVAIESAQAGDEARVRRGRGGPAIGVIGGLAALTPGSVGVRSVCQNVRGGWPRTDEHRPARRRRSRPRGSGRPPRDHRSRRRPRP